MNGRYVLGKKLAVGGMAEIFQARVRGVGGFEKDVVVKRVLPAFAADAGFRARFFQEARLAALLTHPHIVQVYELVEQDGHTLLAMEAVHGADVATLLRSVRDHEQALPLSCALWIASCVADALAYAHERQGPDGAPLGIVHRDVTPSNVLVSAEGVPKLIDFGIAKAASSLPQTQAGLVLGKAWYLSPEQCLGRPVDGRSDVFALGTVLFQMIAGRVPFGGRNGVLAMDKIASGNRPALSALVRDVPRDVEEIVDAALTVDPASRPTARALRAALDRVIAAADPERRGRDLVAALVQRTLERSEGRASKPAPAPVDGLPPAASPTLLLMDLSSVNADALDQTRDDGNDDGPGDETGDTGPGPLDRAADATLEVSPVSVARPASSTRGLVAAAIIAVVGAALAVGVVLLVRGAQARARQEAKVAPAVAPAALELRARAAPPEDDDVEAVEEDEVDDEEDAPDAGDAAPQPRRRPRRARAPAEVPAEVKAAPRAVQDEGRDEPAREERVAGVGHVTFHAEPWAQVWLGGKSLGVTWTGATEVPAGKHELFLKNPLSGHAKRVVVTVKPGSRQSLYVTLEPPRKPK